MVARQQGVHKVTINVLIKIQIFKCYNFDKMNTMFQIREGSEIN